MFSLTISLIAILLAAILLSVSLYYFNASTEHSEKDITAAALISQGEQILAAVDMRAMDNAHDMSHVDFLTDGKYLSTLPTPPTGTYEIGTEKPSPKDWRVLVAAHKPPIVLSEKLDLETCLLVNDKAGLKGIKSTADPTRRIQCFGTEAPFTMLLNPTAKQWETCETNPLLPGCTEEPPYCEANPFAPECIVCKEYPSHPLCKKPEDPCKKDPTLPECNPCVTNPSLPECQPCKLNPNLPECDRCLIDPTLPQCQPCAIDPTLPECQPCKLDPTLPECKPCVINPTLPECQPCVINPTLPECEPPFCELYPDDPICNPVFCELYPKHPLCKETPFCEMYPTHPLCVVCPGGDCEPPTVCEVVETAPCDLTATGSCVEGAYKYTLLDGTIYRCDENPKECKVTYKQLTPEKRSWSFSVAYLGIRTAGGNYGKVTASVLRFDDYLKASLAHDKFTGIEWYVSPIRFEKIDATYEVTNSCTGVCPVVEDFELPIYSCEGLGLGDCVYPDPSNTLRPDPFDWATYFAKLAEFKANPDRYTIVGGKYYDCGGPEQCGTPTTAPCLPGPVIKLDESTCSISLKEHEFFDASNYFYKSTMIIDSMVFRMEPNSSWFDSRERLSATFDSLNLNPDFGTFSNPAFHNNSNWNHEWASNPSDFKSENIPAPSQSGIFIDFLYKDFYTNEPIDFRMEFTSNSFYFNPTLISHSGNQPNTVVFKAAEMNYADVIIKAYCDISAEGLKGVTDGPEHMTTVYEGTLRITELQGATLAN